MSVQARARLRQLFERVIDLPPEQRTRILNEAELNVTERATLASMIDADRNGGTLFDVSATDWATVLDFEPADLAEMVGQNVGPYRIVELLGQGGSAVVFRAKRAIGDVEQTVALKLLQSGLFSAEARRRFRREQEILIHLSHPNVARLIDGGISDAGIPYIAMELISGLDLITYARTHALDRVARLRLLGEVCRAVDAAHRALIVHRDLKPSNVLVSAEGHVKVLDFGIAKLLGKDEPATTTMHIALTPGYAAPEQYLPGPITTSADVYALGVLASELLIGVRLEPDAIWPGGECASAHEARRRWRELDQELVDLVRATLASDPERRYPSAGHLADDIGRYLRNEPITISPPSPWYRFRKFMVRHRGGMALTTIMAIAIIVALALAVWQAQAARREAVNTRAELARANSMRDFMFDAFGDAEPGFPRTVPATVIDAVERAIATARDDRHANPRARIELLTRLSSVLASEGKLDRAADLLARTVANAINTLGADDVLTFEAERASAWNAMLRGDYAGARAQIDRLLTRVPAGRDDLLVRLLLNSAKLATKEQELARARREGRQAFDMARRSSDADLLRVALGSYGNVLLTLGEVADAIPVYEELLNIERARFGDQHASVAAVNTSLSRAYRRNGDLDRAEANARAALAVNRVAYAGDDWHVASTLNALAAVLKERRDYRAALVAESEALEIKIRALGESHPDTITSFNNVGWYQLLIENFTDSARTLRKSLELTVRKFGPEHAESAVARANYGYALAMSGDVVAGTAAVDHAIASYESLANPDPDGLATTLEKRVRISLDHEEATTALPLIDRLSNALKKLPEPDSYWDGRVSTLRGHALLVLHRAKDAERELEKGAAELERSIHSDPEVRVENLLLRASAEQAAANRNRAFDLAEESRHLLSTLQNPPHRLISLAASLPTKRQAQ